MSRARFVVIVAVVAAVAFGLLLGYLAYANDSFPAQERPFGDYASVLYSSFNGTEFALRVQWNSANYLPLYTQLSSPSTDAANTPVCDLGLSSVQKGQVIFMPFTINPASAALSDVDLSIAVQSATNNTSFTITYNIPSINATNSAISPSNIACQEQLGS
jgi:hypothetical protein